MSQPNDGPNWYQADTYHHDDRSEWGDEEWALFVDTPLGIADVFVTMLRDDRRDIAWPTMTDAARETERERAGGDEDEAYAQVRRIAPEDWGFAWGHIVAPSETPADTLTVMFGRIGTNDGLSVTLRHEHDSWWVTRVWRHPLT